MPRTGPVAHEEIHEDQVEDHPEGARDAVLGLAEDSRMMGHHFLCDLARRGHRRQPGRDEAVHLAIQAHILDRAGAEALQAAAIVLQMHAGHARDQPVGDPRRDLAQPQAVLPVLAPAGDQVEVLGQQPVSQSRDVDRIVLQVAVHGHDHAAARRVQTRLHRRGLLEVAHQFDHPHMRAVMRRPAFQFGRGVVAAAVVDQHHFPGPGVGIERQMDACQQWLDVLGLVVHRHHHRQAVFGQAVGNPGFGGRQGLFGHRQIVQSLGIRWAGSSSARPPAASALAITHRCSASAARRPASSGMPAGRIAAAAPAS